MSNISKRLKGKNDNKKNDRCLHKCDECQRDVCMYEDYDDDLYEDDIDYVGDEYYNEDLGFDYEDVDGDDDEDYFDNSDYFDE